jgi:transcriptional regulator with XRE-family HTH domain
MSPMGDELAAVVGERIRRLRLESGLGLRELAAEIGVSPSAISALENHRGGMSIERLQLVAAYFGLELTELLASDGDGAETTEAEPEVFRRAALTTPVVSRGSGVHTQILGRPGGRRLQPALLTFPPEASYERDRIGHPGEEFAYVVLGEVELLVGDEIHRLDQGDAIRFPSDRAHGFRNPSKYGVAMVVTVATPPW